MKALILVTTLIAAQAFGYNSEYTTVKFGEHTQVEVATRSSYRSNVVSLLVELYSKTGNPPVVNISNQDQKNCSHKQTLISFSGFDSKTKLYKRVYEVQIDRNPSKLCYLAIYATNNTQDKSGAARVSILPSR